MMGKRRVIEDAWDKVMAPVVVTGPQLMKSRIQQFKGEQLPPGEATALLQQCNPLEGAFITELHRRRRDAEDMGKHAADKPAAILERVGADPTVERLLDGIDTDEITKGLLARRGSDSDRPLPPPTRADVISAALDNYSIGE